MSDQNCLACSQLRQYSATCRHPLSMVSEWPRPANSLNSVTAGDLPYTLSALRTRTGGTVLSSAPETSSKGPRVAFATIAPDHDLIYAGLTNILEDRLQGREVPMNIIESSDPHDRPASPLSQVEQLTAPSGSPVENSFHPGQPGSQSTRLPFHRAP